MAELSGEALPNFYNSEANERFLSLPEEDGAYQPKYKPEPKHLQGFKNLAERFQRVEGVA